jgi:prevent-host-death family protein
MITVGAFEAKTHLSNLLEQVIAGEEVLITKHGKPVARLIPERAANQAKIDEAIAQLKSIRKNVRLDGLSWQALRDEGRK